MAKLLMIGNGFDLYHKLPTRYTDFLTFVNNWEVFKNKYDTYKDEYGKIVQESINPKKSIDIRLDEYGKLTPETMLDFATHAVCFKNSDIEFLDNNLKENEWIKYFLESDFKEEGWIDFEKEIEDVLIHIENYYCSLDMFIGEIPNKILDQKTIAIFNIFGAKTYKSFFNFNMTILHKFHYNQINFEKHKRDFIEHIKNELDLLNKCLYLYLASFVSIVKCKTFSKQIKNLGEVSLLNFNYTHTFKSVYGEKMIEHHPVHGDLTGGELVLGVSDYMFSDADNKKLDYIYFQKYFQRIQKRTGSFYKKWLERNDGSLIDEIYIMGHSLDKTDKTIIEELFNAKYVRKICIYFHNQWAYENQVIKLIEIFGREYIIDQVANERIIFEKLEDGEIIK